MEKLDLENCSIVVPIYIDCPERLEHLQFIYSYFEKHFKGYELIVVEQGKVSKAPTHPALRFVKSDQNFSPAAASNIGAGFVTKSYFCKCDVDAFVAPKALFEAFERLKKEADLSMIFPYNGISFTVQNDFRKEMMRSFDFTKLPSISKEEIATWSGKDLYIKNGHSTGLIHCFNTSLFKKFGGYNEEFIGWGYEDDEIVARFEKLSRVEYLETFNGYHLDHPRIPGDPLQAFKNQFLSQVVKNMDSEDLLEYIQSWNRFAKILSK